MVKLNTAWKVSKYVVISGPYFPVFGPEITTYLDTFHAVELVYICEKFNALQIHMHHVRWLHAILFLNESVNSFVIVTG